jgi:hypothetical protein
MSGKVVLGFAAERERMMVCVRLNKETHQQLAASLVNTTFYIDIWFEARHSVD